MRFSRQSFLLFIFRISAALAENNQLRPQSSTPSPPNRNIKITNNCPEGLYPAIIGSGGIPLSQTGFYLASNDARTVSVPSSWVGRVWARTNCTFDRNGRGYCSTGDCDKKLMCGATSGEKPHTIAEFTVMGDKNETYYDISTVDGHNVDMAILPEESAGAVLSCSFLFLKIKKEEKTTLLPTVHLLTALMLMRIQVYQNPKRVPRTGAPTNFCSPLRRKGQNQMVISRETTSVPATARARNGVATRIAAPANTTTLRSASQGSTRNASRVCVPTHTASPTTIYLRSCCQVGLALRSCFVQMGRAPL